MEKRRARRRGAFITFEGIEGCGKTTQVRRLAARLRQDGYEVVETREPGGTPLAERIRDLLLAVSAEAVAPECEAHLICAARSQHVTRVIRPAIQRGAIVLCDRFSDSTLAYQGFARGLDIAMLQKLNRFATGGLTPDLTLLLDLPPATGLDRRRRGGSQNRLDREAQRFHRRVRNGFLTLARTYPGRITLIDARPSPAAVESDIAAAAMPLIDRRSTR